MPKTYSALYLDIRKRLKSHGIGAASLEARELVCAGSGKTREEFHRDGGLYVSAEVEQEILTLLDRHLNGEPIAYLIGEWDFYGLTLDVNPSVLIPRIDTEVLAGEVIAYLQGKGDCRVLDLCAGSGCIGLAIGANIPAAKILLGEISEAALRVCRQNIRRTGQSGSAAVMPLDALKEPPNHLGEFDVIVCNPPYIPKADIETLDISVKDFEPYLALSGGEDGYDFYRSIVPKWGKLLKQGGRLYFEVGIDQAATVSQIMKENDFVDIQTVKDDLDIQRVVFGSYQTAE